METPGSSHQDELVSKKGNNVTSVIWKWFGFERSDVKQTLVKCKICRKSVATGSGSTTNLFQHLRQRHQAEWLQCTKLRDENNTVSHPKTTDPPRNAQRQVSLAASFSNAIPYDKNVDWARTSFVNTRTASSWAKMVIRDRFSRWKALFDTLTSLPAKGCCVEKK
ncbi:hypothetical protein E1301_Tti021694 [Triplophysa tibetana]|uniref:BED-type domain-containing protein n=1 Tax=Triplophysa tibetana TaxID=1572043 RepID=A0A5A9PKN2_9TELE|nr:hypothetical protein E1301_Tti021694 [Triplophysa tibetana]